MVRGRRKARREKGEHTFIHIFPPIMVLRVLAEINPTALLRGNVRHELVHCSKERVVLAVVLGGKSVMAVGARCTDDVRANKRLVARGCCVPYVE